MASDTTVLWTNQTFNAPYANNIVVSSNTISNSSNYKAGVKAVIEYQVLDPDGANSLVGYILQAVIEEQIATNVWVPLAVQFDEIKGTDEAQVQVIDLRPGFVENFGAANKLTAGGQEVSAVSIHDGSAPESLRVCVRLIVTDETRPQLSSVTLSGWVTLYDR